MLKRTKKQIKDMLLEFLVSDFPNGNCSKLEEYKLFVIKEKLIYHNLNKLTV